MGRRRGPIRRVADALNFDQATVRRAMTDTNMNETDIEADFERACETVRAVVDKDKLHGHALAGRGDNRDAELSPLAKAKAEAEFHRAEKLRIQNEVLRGKLIDREHATETLVGALGDLRSAILATPIRVAQSLAGLTDTKQIAAAIEGELRRMLETFADADRLLSDIALE